MRKNKSLKITVLLNAIRRETKTHQSVSFKISKASAEILVGDGSIKQRHCP